MRIVIVAPYEKLAMDAKQVCRRYGENIEVIMGRMNAGIEQGKQAVIDGADVLISRGGTWVKLCEQVKVPVIEIAVTPYDVLRTLAVAKSTGTRFGIAGFFNVIESVPEWSDLLRVPIVPIEIKNDGPAAWRQVKEIVKKEKLDCILGDSSVVEHAADIGVPGVLIESGKEAIWAAVQEAKRIIQVKVSEQKKNVPLHSALNSAQFGLIMIEDDYIFYANRTAQTLLEANLPERAEIKRYLPQELYHFLKDTNEEPQTDVFQISGEMWAVECTDLGAGKLLVTLHKIDNLREITANSRKKNLSSGYRARYTFGNLIGHSESMQATLSRAIEFSKTDFSVLIVGETGTGKEVLAQSIHNSSSRSDGPFVAINCGALPEQLLESELFGYEEGAFTGAKRGGKPGIFEMASGGTVFLDEIGETTLQVQQRLLRVLQEREVMRVGSERIVPVNVRVIAATNRSLWELSEKGLFRKDLLFRLDTLRLNTPSLRTRPEDIPELVDHLLLECWYENSGVGAKVRIDPEAYELLSKYDWPGNVRELKNMVDYLFATSKNGIIGISAIQEWLNLKMLDSPSRTTVPTFPKNWTLEQIEQWAIERTLKWTNGDISKAASRLGISRTTIWRRLKDLEQ